MALPFLPAFGGDEYLHESEGPVAVVGVEVKKRHGFSERELVYLQAP